MPINSVAGRQILITLLFKLWTLIYWNGVVRCNLTCDAYNVSIHFRTTTGEDSGLYIQGGRLFSGQHVVPTFWSSLWTLAFFHYLSFHSTLHWQLLLLVLKIILPSSLLYGLQARAMPHNTELSVVQQSIHYDHR